MRPSGRKQLPEARPQRRPCDLHVVLSAFNPPRDDSLNQRGHHRTLRRDVPTPHCRSHPSAAARTVANDGGVMLDATTSSRLSSSDAASRSTRAVPRIRSYPDYRCPR
jgi:hypothetical protein